MTGDGQCAAKGCLSDAKISLRLAYLNLIGSFCDSCANALLKDGLAVKEEIIGTPPEIRRAH